MNKLKRYFLELNNKKLKKAEKSAERHNVNYQRAKSVGILFSSENLENIEPLINLVKSLQQDGKNVKVLTYYDSQSKNPLKTLNFNHHVVTEKDITFWGNINSFLVEEFVKTNFDYLLCVDVSLSDVLENILLRSSAKCRIGKYQEGQNNFELMIKMNDSDGTDALIKQMYHYVKTIKND